MTETPIHFEKTMLTHEANDTARATGRVFILGDCAVARQGLARIAEEAGLNICGQAAHPREGFEEVNASASDLVLMDQPSGMHEVVHWVKEATRRGKPPVAVFSPRADAVLAERVLRAGASGYLLKTDSAHALVEGVKQLLRGGIYVSQSIGIALVCEFIRRGPAADVMSDQNLSRREIEVLDLVGLGLGTRDIATKLYISTKTVEAHRWHIKQKLNLRRAQDLTRYAMRRALES